MIPSLGSISLINSRITVDLPDPVAPTRNTNSSRLIAKVAWSSPTSPPGYSLDTPRNSMIGGPLGRCRAGFCGRVLGATVIFRAAGCRSMLRGWDSEVAIAAGQGIDRGGGVLRHGWHATRLSMAATVVSAMSAISRTTLENGLPLYRIAVPGTRAVTVLVAFDAGARTERAEENGMAHFLEHLVFKGGEKYPTYRDVNEAAERIGAVLNAYTSHDLVAVHITARAEAALAAADLLTDFVGRSRIDGDELDRQRGAGAVRPLRASAGAGSLRPAAGARATRARERARFEPVTPAYVLSALRRSRRYSRAGGVGYLHDAARRLDGFATVRRDSRAAW